MLVADHAQHLLPDRVDLVFVYLAVDVELAADDVCVWLLVVAEEHPPVLVFGLDAFDEAVLVESLQNRAEHLLVDARFRLDVVLRYAFAPRVGDELVDDLVARVQLLELPAFFRILVVVHDLASFVLRHLQEPLFLELVQQVDPQLLLQLKARRYLFP